MIWKLLTAVAIAYLGWRAWHGWGKLPGTPKPAPAPRMDREEAEARQTLGLGPNDGAAEVRAAHRRLMAQAHPDRGGSPEQARRINAARDFLLDRLDAGY